MSEAHFQGLDELETDALTELVNLGVSRAALSLRDMAGEEVLLTVPAISTVSPDQAAEMIGGARVPELVAVEQAFDGDFAGRALLIFPAANSLELVRAVSGGNLGAAEVAELASEALCETGNVLLQACLSTIGNMLNRTLGVSVPHLLRGKARDLFPPTANSVVVFIYINFALRGRRIRGYIALLLDLPTMAGLKTLIADFIHRQTQGDAASV
jgi:chemotaxis protein CheC